MTGKLAMSLAVLLVCSSFAVADEIRSESHSDYAANLWEYLQKSEYPNWAKAEAVEMPFGPPACHEGATYANAMAAKTKPDFEYGSLIITDNKSEGGKGTSSVTVWYKVKPGFDKKRNDWYWAVFSPEGKIIKTSADKNKHDVRGFYVQEDDGRLWVFHIHSAELAAFLADGDLAKRVTRVSAGPGGETLMSGTAEDIDNFLAAASSGQADPPAPAPSAGAEAPQKAGFVTKMEDGRLWIFKEGSDELAAFEETGDLAKRVTRVAAGPGGVTVMAPDAETIDQYLTGKKGFATMIEDGRLWVFKEGSEELAAFKEAGDLAKRVTRVSAGPGGMTIMAPDAETIDAYLAD